jgi:hypothetical protein
MNVAILHYHLNRGGVTQVIFNHLFALDSSLTGECWRVAILFGGRYDVWLERLKQLRSIDVCLCKLPALDYDGSKDSAAQPAEIGAAIAGQLAEIGFDPAETVIHAHNATLGLNVSLPGALTWLADRGYATLLQVHDFAEDFRAANFRRLAAAGRAAKAIAKRDDGTDTGDPFESDLPPDVDTSYCYPQCAHIHYAVLSQRDFGVLTDAGVPQQRLHLLRNPVCDPEESSPRETARKRLKSLFDVNLTDQYVLYPVRSVRRKNIGEALFRSLFASRKTTFGITLPPDSPSFHPVYESWKHLVEVLDLPCRFEVGREGGLRYFENIAAADLIVTTSLVEGFGMVYLETWLTDHVLAGRDLPEITSDFADLGLQYDRLSTGLANPIDWIGEREFGAMLREGYEKVLHAYGVIPNTDHQALEMRIEQRLDEKWVDFGELHEPMQQLVVDHTARSHSAKTRLGELNESIETSLRPPDHSARRMIARNANVVRNNFGLRVKGQELEALYRTVAASERDRGSTPLERPGRIIDFFLDARRFRPLAT